MTYEQAMQKLEQDRIAIEQALSDLQTAKHLNAIGETDKAVDLYASIRAKVRQQVTNR